MPNVDSVPFAALGDELSTITMYLSYGGPCESDPPVQVEQAIARWDDLIGRIIAGRALCLADVRAKLLVVDALTRDGSTLTPHTWNEIFDEVRAALEHVADTAGSNLRPQARAVLELVEALDEQDARQTTQYHEFDGFRQRLGDCLVALG